MKTISNILLFVFALAGSLAAQEKKESPPAGFIRIVNAVAAGEGQVSVTINGKDIRPSGYKLGDATGGIGLKAGSHKVTVKKEGLEEASTTIELDKDKTVTLIPFAERVPATDQKPAHFAVRILRLKQKEPESGKTATFVSVSANPEIKAEVQSEEGVWATVFVKRLMIAETPLIYSQGYAPAKVNGTDIKPIPIGGSGNYVVVLYDDAEGKVMSLYFRDFKFLSAD